MEGARAATPADAARVAELAQLAVDEQRPARGGAVYAVREAARLPSVDVERALGDADTAVLVGTIDEFVVGYATVRSEAVADGGRLGFVEELFVEADGRGVGVGEALLDEALAWCRARGCFGVDATALPGNRATKNFFEASGFTARLLVMHHRLDA